MKVNLSLFQFILSLIIVHAEIDPSWVHPHAWKNSDPGEGVALVTATGNPPAAQDKAVQLFYKKLIRNIFSRNQMSLDEISNHYVRIVKFEITGEQLEILHTTEDVYELDTVVSQILYSSQSSALTENFEKVSRTFGAVFHGVWSSPELRFIFLIAGILCALWYIAAKFDFSWIKVFFLSIFGMLLFGFFHTYYECNRELEVEELLKLIEADDPCEDHLKEKERSWFWSLFGKSKKQECLDHIKNSHKTKLPFCRPDKVLLTYLNDIIYHQLETFLSRTGTAFQKSFGNVGIVYTTIGSIMLICLLSMVIKPTVKYLIKYFMRYFWPNSQQQHQRPAPVAAPAHQHLNMLSGENVDKLITLSQNLSQVMSNALKPSGVEVLETLRLKNEDTKKAVKDVPSSSNAEAIKPPSADSIADNVLEFSTLLEQNHSKNDVNEQEDEMEPNEQKPSHGDIEGKIKVS